MQNDFNTITVENIGALWVMAVRGDVTAASEPYFIDAYAKTRGARGGWVLVGLEPTAHIDSGGIYVLIQVMRLARQDDRQAAIAGFSDHYRKIFRMVGIDRLATLYDSLEAALRELNPESSAG